MNLKTSDLIKTIPTHTKEFNRVMESNYYKWLKGSFGDRQYEIYPKVYQNSDAFREFRFNLFRRLYAMTPCDLEWSSSNQLLGEMGTASSHLLLPFNDSEVLRSQLKLRKIENDELSIIDELLNKVIANAEWKSFSVKDKSSSGFPFFIKGVGYKLSEVSRIFSKLDSIFYCCSNHDIIGVRKIVGCFPIFTLGVRYQIDPVVWDENLQRASNAKKRQAYTPEYIKTNGERGEIININYEVRNNAGVTDPRFIAARVRSMYALSYSYNCVIQAVNNFLMSGLKKIAPEILFSTPKKALDQLNAKGIVKKITTDFGNFGETMPGIVVELLCQKLEKVRPGLGEFVRITFNAPKLVRGWEKNINNPFFTSDSVNYFKEITASLASGHGLVAFLGKFNAVVDGLLVMRKLISNFNLELHLNNQYPHYTRLTSSDDGIIAITDNKLEMEYRDNFAALSLYKAEITESPVYLGWIYLENRVTRDIARLLEHLTNFERSMHTKMFFELGIGCSIKEYMLNSHFSDVFPILRDAFLELNVPLERYLDEAEKIAEPTAIFLANPDSIFYKLDPKLVNTGIYKKYFANVSEELVKERMGVLKCA